MASEDLIAWKWVESLSEEQQSVLISGSIKRLQSIIVTALTAARAEQRERLIRVLGPEEVSDLAHHAIGVWQAFEDNRLFANTKENWQKAHDAAEDAKEIARLAAAIRAGKE